MASVTEDLVQRLAPDTDSYKAARGLVNSKSFLKPGVPTAAAASTAPFVFQPPVAALPQPGATFSIFSTFAATAQY